MQTGNVPTPAAIVDAGPLYAVLDRRDAHHPWASAVMESLAPPLLTCEAVISEVSFLLRRTGQDSFLPLRLIERDVVRIAPVLTSSDEVSRVRRLMDRYANVPMSLADACIVRLAEQHPGADVLTLDSDFSVYRRNGRQPISLLAPTS